MTGCVGCCKATSWVSNALLAARGIDLGVQMISLAGWLHAANSNTELERPDWSQTAVQKAAACSYGLDAMMHAGDTSLA